MCDLDEKSGKVELSRERSGELKGSADSKKFSGLLMIGEAGEPNFGREDGKGSFSEAIKLILNLLMMRFSDAAWRNVTNLECAGQAEHLERAESALKHEPKWVVSSQALSDSGNLDGSV